MEEDIKTITITVTPSKNIPDYEMTGNWTISDFLKTMNHIRRILILQQKDKK